MTLALTIDYEGWAQTVYAEATGLARPIGRPALERATDALLERLDRHGVKATVFLLGTTADAFPDLAARIAHAGHEIGCHGYRHVPVGTLDRDAFAGELRRAREVIASVTGAVPRGFRAPYFSIRRDTLWALEVIADAGFVYDSSIFPIWHRRYGIPGWPTQPHRVAGGRLVELPLATLAFGPVRLPVAGGGYWRLLPPWATVRAIHAAAAEGPPTVLYLHPYQLDAAPPERVPGPLPLRGRLHADTFRLAQSIGQSRALPVLDTLLTGASFTTLGQLADTFLTEGPWQPIQSGRGLWGNAA